MSILKKVASQFDESPDLAVDEVCQKCRKPVRHALSEDVGAPAGGDAPRVVRKLCGCPGSRQ